LVQATSTRREYLRSGVLAVGALLAPMLNLGRCRLLAHSSRQYSTRTSDLVERSLVIDMLGLVTLDWPKQRRWFADPLSFADADARRVRSSAINVFHPAVHFASPEPDRTGRQVFGDWNRFLECRSDIFLRVAAAEDLAVGKASGRIGVVLGMQDSRHFLSADDVDRYYAWGQRVSQLTYNHRDRIGSGCLERTDRGLTA
jgi:membrane dipeptidase